MADQQQHTGISAESFAIHEDTAAFIVQALKDGDTGRVRDLARKLHKGDIAELLHVLSPEERKQFVESILDTLDPELLVWLEGEVKGEVIAQLGTEESAAAITKLEHDDAVQVIEDLSEQEQTDILEAVPEEFRKELELGLALPEDAAGRIMDTRFVAVPLDWDVGQAIDHLRGSDDLPQDFYSLYLTDAKNRPAGSVLVSRVVRNRREIPLKDIMEEKLYTVKTTTDQEEVAYMFSKYALASVPVVDSKGVMAGVISIDDIMDVIEEETEEDIFRLAGISGETDIYSSMLQTAKNRLPWLSVNMFTALAASRVIAQFEGAISQLVTLAVLMPIVASMAGNAGTQTLAVAVRGLAMKELTRTNAGRVIGKETLTGMLNGLLLALMMVVVTWLLYRDMHLSMVFGTAIVTALTIATFVGSLVPLLLARAKVDPAVSSGVFLTAITDCSSFFIFLGLASWWLF